MSQHHYDEPTTGSGNISGNSSFSDSKSPFWDSRLSQYGDFGVGSYLSVIGTTGFFMNSVVLGVTYKRRKEMKPLEQLLSVVAANDFLMTFLFILPVVAAFRHTWSFGEIGCIVYAFFGLFTGFGKINLATFIAVARCITICHRKRVTIKAGLLAVLITSLYTLLLCTLPLFGFGKYGPEPDRNTCSIDWTSLDNHNRVFVTMVFSLAMFLPTTINSISYGRIWWFVRNSSQSQQRNIAMAKNWILVTAGNIICWGPYGVVCMISVFGPAESIPMYIHILPNMFAKFSVVLDPIIYFYCRQGFQGHLKSALPTVSVNDHNQELSGQPACIQLGMQTAVTEKSTEDNESSL